MARQWIGAVLIVVVVAATVAVGAIGSTETTYYLRGGPGPGLTEAPTHHGFRWHRYPVWNGRGEVVGSVTP